MDEGKIMQALGEIKGMLASEIELSREHRDDDKRRFDGTFKRLDTLDAEVNRTKGAVKVVTWLLSGGAISIIGLVLYMTKLGGGH